MQTQIQSLWRPSDSTVLSSKLVRRLSKATRLLFSFRLSSQGDHLDCMRCSLLGSQPSCCQKRFCRPSVLVFRGRVGLFVGRSRKGGVRHSRKMFGPVIGEYNGLAETPRNDDNIKSRKIAYFEYIQHNHSSRTNWHLHPHLPRQTTKLSIPEFHNSTLTEQSQDSRTLIKWTEHNGASSIFVEVGNGLGSRSSGIDVSSCIRTKNREGCWRKAFWRYVDVRAIARCGGDVEERLRHAPVAELCG